MILLSFLDASQGKGCRNVVKLQIRRWAVALLILLCLITSFPIVSFGENTESLSTNTPLEVGSRIGTEDFLASIIKVILALIVIIGIFYLIIKFLSQKNRAWLGHRSLRFLGGTQVGQNKSIQLMELGNSIYIIGVGDDVRLIDKIDRPEEVDFILASFREQEAMSGQGLISAIRNKFSFQRKSNESSDAYELDESTFQDVFNSKIKSMSDRNKTIDQWLSEHRREER